MSAGTTDSGCFDVVLRTGFGTAQGQFNWSEPMIFFVERVSANNFVSGSYSFLPLLPVVTEYMTK